ncbi:3-ketoacyl-acyl carrier protein reductase [Schizosaccharomyces cryophilus OY26]|uniref:3-ketoacyl-acyl carrier protein reductase n=1 Tax=Schizosaccharomyces cryophilus (strain OY26 / ATCC MYA-4695 / CBS 11777 / NBRC 106824 / NRRL Y48691) TaxID=653667 RepID=S9VUU7_SCHCR|nr:3-ketoacyl-acyl carrier protein reductase [Schizosaccharomyces cryophilus OY26]EPY51573.1 3-ketoacyl-acyl carrier protein reductase [Schizosaccharomyces cryophilus OY26]
MSENSLPLQNKVAIVTGASRGIGAAIAETLARRGAKVAITFTSDSSIDATEQLVKKIKGFGTSADAIKIQADLRDVSSAKHIVNATVQAFGPTIHILVNNAGYAGPLKPIGTITMEDYNSMFDVNVRGVFFMTEAIVPHLPKKEKENGGRIINFGSVAGRLGFLQQPVYCASKAAIEGFTRCWAAELGPRGHTVNQVNPGAVDTDMLKGVLSDEVIQFAKKTTPFENRIGLPSDIAEIVAFLAEDRSRWITGQVISASGGWAMY